MKKQKQKKGVGPRCASAHVQFTSSKINSGSEPSIKINGMRKSHLYPCTELKKKSTPLLQEDHELQSAEVFKRLQQTKGNNVDLERHFL